jgi:chromosome segregation ATPase
MIKHNHKESNMIENEKSTVTYNLVESKADEMVGNGIAPTVKGLRGALGGRTENIARYLKEYHAKQKAKADKIADEIGSQQIGRLLAAEMQNIVTRKTQEHLKTIEGLETQNEEYVSLLEEKEDECSQRIQKHEDDMRKAISIAEDNAKKSADKVEAANNEKHNALEALEQISSESASKVKYEEERAKALVEASERRLESAESELKGLRVEVNALRVDEAKRQIEKEQFEQTKLHMSKLQDELADHKTMAVKVSTENIGLDKDVNRLYGELKEVKAQLEKMNGAQALLVESQKKEAQLLRDLNQTEREVKSLSQALAISESAKR